MAGAQPLKGLKVVELARILAGPWAGQIFADLGCEVIKVESPAGDDTRQWGPPFIDDRDGTKDAAYFHACNRGKSSITADFRNAQDLASVKKLIAEADIVIENFKVGGLEQFGLDYETLSKDHPRLIYCSITGFGQDGPYKERAGYDFIIQGMSGMMDLTGDPEGEPQKIGVALADIIAGLYATIGIQSAIIERERTGLGVYIDVALLDSMVGVLANQAMNYLLTGHPPQRMGNAHPNICPYEVFPAVDGHFVLAVGNDRQFRRLCEIVEQPQLSDDPRFSTNAARVEHREALRALLEARFVHLGCAEILRLCEEQGVPAGRINNLKEVFEDPQVKARQLVLDLPGGVRGVRTPINYNGKRLFADGASPKLGSANGPPGRSIDEPET